MKEVRDIANGIKEDLDSAEKCVAEAARAKAEGDTESMTEYAKLAEAKLSHAMIRHSLAAKKIARFKAANPDYSPPKIMEDMWKENHEMLTKRYGELKYAIEALKK